MARCTQLREEDPEDLCLWKSNSTSFCFSSGKFLLDRFVTCCEVMVPHFLAWKHTHTQGRNGPIRLSPTEHPNADPNPKKIAHSVFTYQTQTPTDDPNRAPIFGTGQAGTQICVLSLHDAFSGQASGWSRRGELSSRRGAAGGVDPCSGNGGGGRPPAEHRGTRAAAGAAPPSAELRSRHRRSSSCSPPGLGY